jgi:hypothetical protein
MSYVIKDNRGRPVGTASTKDAAESFAYRNTFSLRQGKPTSWSPTGKLLAGNRWTGWEVVLVPNVESA